MLDLCSETSRSQEKTARNAGAFPGFLTPKPPFLSKTDRVSELSNRLLGLLEPREKDEFWSREVCCKENSASQPSGGRGFPTRKGASSGQKAGVFDVSNCPSLIPPWLELVSPINASWAFPNLPPHLDRFLLPLCCSAPFFSTFL